MFSKENQAWLYDDEPAKPLPVAKMIQSPEPPIAAPARSGKLGIVIVAALFLGVVGIAVGSQFVERERRVDDVPTVAKAEPKAEPKAEAPKPVEAAKPVAKSDCDCGGGCKCAGTCACDKTPSKTATEEPRLLVKQEPPKVEPKPAPPAVVKEQPKAAPVIKEQKPLSGPIDAMSQQPGESDKAWEARIRAKVIAEREERIAKTRRELGEDEPKPDEKPQAKDDGRPTLYIVAGAKLPADLTATLEKDFQIESVEKTANGATPRIEWTSPRDKEVYVIRPPFNESTAKKIRANFGLVKASEKFPQIDYPVNLRNRNSPEGGGCCFWAAASTLARTHGYDFRLENNKRGGAVPYDVYRVLKSNGIPSQWTPYYQGKDIQYLRDACDAGLGATAGVCLGYQQTPQGPIPMLHEINIAGVSDTHVATLDNNDRSLKIRTATRESFMKAWDGNTLVIFPKGMEKNPLEDKWGRPNSRGMVAFKSRQWGQDGCRPSPAGQRGPRDLSDDGPIGPGGPNLPNSDDETGFYRSFGNSKQMQQEAEKNGYEFLKSCGYSDAEIAEQKKAAVGGPRINSFTQYTPGTKLIPDAKYSLDDGGIVTFVPMANGGNPPSHFEVFVNGGKRGGTIDFAPAKCDKRAWAKCMSEFPKNKTFAAGATFGESFEAVVVSENEICVRFGAGCCGPWCRIKKSDSLAD